MLLVNRQAKFPHWVHPRSWLLLVLATCFCAADLTSHGMGADTRILLVVLDGFRSDYFTPELMPRCYAAAQKGVIGKAHHAVLPTVTRVNASTLVTGSFPAHHGLVANTLYVPSLNPSGGISTGSRKRLLAVTEAWGGHLLAVPTLAELLAEQGQSYLACSSGSSGSATLLNPTGAGAGILHPEFCVLEDQTRHMYEIVGPKPQETEPAREMMRWMTDAYLKIGVPEHDPRVTVLWFTDPDHTAHAKGVGAPKALEGIRIADEQLGRILDFHRERGMKVNVFIVADHGFATYGGRFNVARSLEASGWMERAKPVVIEGAIYLSPDHESDIAEIVRVLQGDASVGPILTRAKAPGELGRNRARTLSQALAGGGHPHGAQIIVYPKWTAATNAAGYPGTVESARRRWPRGYFTLGDQGVFAAFGPDIKTGVSSEAPSSNADLAPTIAFLTGVPIPKTMDGRVLHEVLLAGRPRKE